MLSELRSHESKSRGLLKALFFYETPINWASLNKIQGELEVYYKSFKDIVSISLNGDDSDDTKIEELFLKHDFETLIFYDHRLKPLRIISSLKELGFYQKPRKHIFHIFSHPTNDLLIWNSIFKIIEGHECSIMVTCQEVADVWRNLLNKEMSPAVHVYRPAPDENIKFDSDARRLKRQDLRINNQEVALLYVGRLSYSKNIDLIIESFNQWRGQDEKLKLILCGNFDDMGIPSYGENDTGLYSSWITKKINESKYQKDIHYIPFQNELTEIYSCGDILLNFSTLWGEDYGLSVAEALVTGLPCLLTEWMGLKDYKTVGGSLVSTFKVRYESNRYHLDPNEMFAAFKHIMNLPRKDRENQAKAMKQKLGKESYLAQLEGAKDSQKIKINQKLVNLWFNQNLTTRVSMALNKMQNEI